MTRACSPDHPDRAEPSRDEAAPPTADDAVVVVPRAKVERLRALLTTSYAMARVRPLRQALDFIEALLAPAP